MVILDLQGRVVIRRQVLVDRETGGADKHFGAQAAEVNVAVAAQVRSPIFCFHGMHEGSHPNVLWQVTGSCGCCASRLVRVSVGAGHYKPGAID